jgi:hypothetical protein
MPIFGLGTGLISPLARGFTQNRTGQTAAFPQSVRPFMTVPWFNLLSGPNPFALPGAIQ